MRMKNVKNTQQSQNRPLPLAPGLEPQLHCVDSEPYLVASKPDEYEMPNLNKDSEFEPYLVASKPDEYEMPNLNKSDFSRQQQPGARGSENIYSQPISYFSPAENSQCASYIEIA